MYKFKKANENNKMMGNGKLAGMYEYDDSPAHSLFIGQVITCFGEPDYVTENNEDLCSWSVVASDEAGEEINLEIYYGPSGPAIGGPDGAKAKSAADELVKIIKEAKPSEFHYESIYEDMGVKVKMGVKNGVPYYDSEMPEDF